jgi:RNA polymerase sigma-70 factor (ECF subfamily)
VRQETNEQQIVEAVLNGRSEGQEAMVCRYAERVFAMVVRQVPDVMDAQELTQDTFLRAFSHIGSYDASKASLSTWLCRIAYRLTLDFLKRRRPVIVSIENSQEWQRDISDEQLEAELSTGREERIEKLMEVVDDLPDDERMLLTMYYFEDRPLTEIAYITGIDAKALANRLYRTRKKLCKKLNIENGKQ